MQILNHLSDLGSNLQAPKKDNLSLNMSIGINSCPIVLSCISEYGNFSIKKALLMTCLKSLLLAKNLLIGKLCLKFKTCEYNKFISLAIASGCSNSDPSSSNLLAILGSSLFLEINQKLWLFSFLLKSIFIKFP